MLRFAYLRWVLVAGLCVVAGVTPAHAANKSRTVSQKEKLYRSAPSAAEMRRPDPNVPAHDAYMSVLVWATGRNTSAFLEDRYSKIERAAFRYNITPEFALSVVCAEEKCGNRISFARLDSWQMYETASGQSRKPYPSIFDDLDTAFSEMSQIMPNCPTYTEAFKQYWCGSKGQYNQDSYKQFADAAGRIWLGLKPYADERIASHSPDRYKAEFISDPDRNRGGGGYGSSWSGLADGDLKGYASALDSMPALASQLKPYSVENIYAQKVRQYNHRLTNDESIVIARAVLTFSAKTNGAVDPRLVMALIKAESNFRPDAVSNKGALGLGQLMPATARGMGISNPMDPIQNIWGCVKYLEREHYRWRNSENSIDLMLASYNAGAGAVQRYGGIPPYTQTRNYVKIVRQNYRTYTGR